jgi:flagellar motility protein MotE (MotC chaperone)
VPSLALPLWLVLAATSGSDSQAAVRAPKPSAPSAPVAPAAKPVAGPSRPVDATAPKAPATSTTKTGGIGKPPPAAEQSNFEEPEEEIFPDSKSKGHRKGSRKAAAVDRPEPAERRTGWTADRYAAVVPPGLTLAALHSQLSKAQAAQATDPAAATSDQGPGASLADIEKAREALRQETARLEALLKATGNCGGGVGMPIGDSPTVVSPVVLREAPTEQIDSVSKAMKSMKPEQAAALVARLDRGLAAEIMRRMKPADAGAILGMLKPELAAELATQIATRKSPAAKDKKGGSK